MNKDLTIVFSSYESKKLLTKILKKVDKEFHTIIIENSQNIDIKNSLENEFKNVKVIIPKKNLGLAKSYNLGIKRSKTKYVFLNNPDIEIENKAIKNLLSCARKIKNLGILSPTYKIEKIYKNYSIYKKKPRIMSENLKKFYLKEVDYIDNNFLIRKSKNNQSFFDENFFLYFETLDFCSILKKKGKKLYVSNKIKFHHYGSSSIPKKYNNLVKKTRAFHYLWSKFYFYKKNFNFLLALKKTLPNLVRSIKQIIANVICLKFLYVKLNLLEFFGLICSILNLRSFYRPKN